MVSITLLIQTIRILSRIHILKKQYGTVPEYRWETSPESAVLRHRNGKWYAVLMKIKKEKLGLKEAGEADEINVKCEPDMVGFLTQTYGFLPGYHMNCLLYTSRCV